MVLLTVHLGSWMTVRCTLNAFFCICVASVLERVLDLFMSAGDFIKDDPCGHFKDPLEADNLSNCLSDWSSESSVSSNWSKSDETNTSPRFRFGKSILAQQFLQTFFLQIWHVYDHVIQLNLVLTQLKQILPLLISSLWTLFMSVSSNCAIFICSQMWLTSARVSEFSISRESEDDGGRRPDVKTSPSSSPEFSGLVSKLIKEECNTSSTPRTFFPG